MRVEAEKVCSHCKATKPISAFSVSRAKRDGRDHRCKECMRGYRRERLADSATRARTNAASLAWYHRNQERCRANMAEWHKRNPENGTERMRRWTENNPAGVAAKNARRKAKLLGSTGSHTAAEARAILVAQRHRCANCEADLCTTRKHLDHVFPLARGGSNRASNLQWLCQPCNNRKHALDPFEWLAREGKLSLLNRTNHAS